MDCANGANLRYLRKTANEGERRLFQSWWKDIVNMYGTYIDYYTYDYQTSAHDFFYGEHPLAPFSGPKGMAVYAQFQNDSLMLSKFGIINDADVLFIIPIMAFREIMGSNVEPKAGDLIRMTELGWDRPGGIDDFNDPTVSPISACEDTTNPLDLICQDGLVNVTQDCDSISNPYSQYDDASAFDALIRGAPIFEITERRDENFTMQFNPIAGHYVWILHAKRFDYSYQPNAPREPGSDQVSDETLYGKLSGGTNYPEASKPYDQNINEEAKKDWDYDGSDKTDDQIYGDY